MFYEIIFSPTGGTKRVADLLCEGLVSKNEMTGLLDDFSADGELAQLIARGFSNEGDLAALLSGEELSGEDSEMLDLFLGAESESEIIDLCDRELDFTQYCFTDEDVCLFAVPSYGGRVPEIAAQRIGTFKGNGAKAILTVVIGNRAYDDTLVEMQDIVKEAGFVSVAAVVGNAEHSIMNQFGTGRPDAEDETELKEYAETIRMFLEQGQYGNLEVPGNRPYTKFNGLPMKPSADKKCSKCGKCARLCPVGAISLENPSETDKDLCITCMRCVSICPEGARGLNKMMLSAASVALKKACSDRKINELYLATEI